VPALTRPDAHNPAALHPQAGDRCLVEQGDVRPVGEYPPQVAHEGPATGSARVRVQPRHGHALARHVDADVHGVSQLVGDPVHVVGRDRAQRLHEVAVPVVTAAVEDVLRMPLRGVRDAGCRLEARTPGREAAAGDRGVAALGEALLEHRDHDLGVLRRPQRRHDAAGAGPGDNEVDLDVLAHDGSSILGRQGVGQASSESVTP